MGFAGAPVSTALLAGATVGPMLVSFLGVPYRFTLRMDPQILGWHQYYRFISCSLIWTEQANVLLGVLNLYNLRILERFFGTRRFAKVALSAWALSTALTGAVAWGLFTLFNVNLVFQAGQTGLVAALLAWYIQLVPPTYYVKLGSVTISDKYGAYAVFLMSLRDWGDIIKVLCGIASQRLISLWMRKSGVVKSG